MCKEHVAGTEQMSILVVSIVASNRRGRNDGHCNRCDCTNTKDEDEDEDERKDKVVSWLRLVIYEVLHLVRYLSVSKTTTELLLQ